MRIKVTTGGPLSRFLPPGSGGNSAEIEVADGATPIQVLEQLGMPPDGSYLIILNDTVVPKAERAGRKLAEGDKLSIVPPLRGG